VAQVPDPDHDPVEAALADALKLAADAGRWSTVEALSRELGARRHARTAPEVPTLDGERAKRKGKGQAARIGTPATPARVRASWVKRVTDPNDTLAPRQSLVLFGELLRIANQAVDVVPALRNEVETPFPDAFAPNAEDGFAVFDLLGAIADAIGGHGSWVDVRSAHRGLIEERGSQDRQATAIARCEWAIKAWVSIGVRSRRRGETADRHAERLEGFRLAEERVARTLIGTLTEQQPAFHRLKVRDVRGALSHHTKPIPLLEPNRSSGGENALFENLERRLPQRN
jgi:hypothetical protein